jgi:5-hydroxyisourate hydrolase
MTRRPPLTSHVLDTAIGRPASGLGVGLDRLDADGSWITLARTVTDEDGRAADLMTGGELTVGTYRVTFDTGAYFEASHRPVFYPRVDVVFRVDDRAQHYHVPLLLSPFGYSTYRGS